MNIRKQILTVPRIHTAEEKLALIKQQLKGIDPSELFTQAETNIWNILHLESE